MRERTAVTQCLGTRVNDRNQITIRVKAFINEQLEIAALATDASAVYQCVRCNYRCVFFAHDHKTEPSNALVLQLPTTSYN